mgnify:CR=1 FL=1
MERNCCAVKCTLLTSASVVDEVADAEAPVALPLMRCVGALDIDLGRLSRLGMDFSDRESLHATQPSNRSWKTKLTTGKRLMRTSATMPSRLK